jgi:hypothetical protein
VDHHVAEDLLLESKMVIEFGDQIGSTLPLEEGVVPLIVLP